MNNLINKTYWTVWANLRYLDPRDEQGIETIEWIAVAAVVLILLLAVQTIFDPMGYLVGMAIVAAILEWIGKFT